MVESESGSEFGMEGRRQESSIIFQTAHKAKDEVRTEDKSIMTDYLDFARNNLISNVVPFQQVENMSPIFDQGSSHDSVLKRIL